jgi:hypothetical protein
MVTIGTIYKSGSAIVATTGSESKADSAMVAIRIINSYKSRQCHCGHRQPSERYKQQSEKSLNRNEIRLLVHWGGQQEYQVADSVNVTIGNEQQADSAMVAIRGNTITTDRQSQHDHRSPTTITDSVMVTIGAEEPDVSFPTVWVKATAAAN